MNEPDSIYQAPASDTNVAPDGDLMAAFVGPRYSEFYQPVFERFDRGGSSVSWNWPAFFIAAIWLLYRKMWLLTVTYWFLAPLTFAIIAGVVASAQQDPLESVLAFNATYYGLYILFGFVVVPLFANRLYYNHAKKKIAKATGRSASPDQATLDVVRAGGTSGVGVVVAVLVVVSLIGVLAAIAIPAYQDYTIRAQVSEGLTLSNGAKAAVTEYYRESGDFPPTNMAAGLDVPARISGQYVQSVAVDEGWIVVTYGQQAHELLQGRTLYLAPTADDTAITWECGSEGIAPRHLPAACR